MKRPREGSMWRLALCVFLLTAALGLSACLNSSENPCNQTVSSLGAIPGAISSAATGDTICVSDGTYGKLSVSTSKPVTIRAENPGETTIAGATISGRAGSKGYGVQVARFRSTGTLTAAVGSRGATFRFNDVLLNQFNGYGAMACASSSTTCDDVSYIGNRFVGRSEEDAMRANRYHDFDGDSNGLLVLGNEFSGNQETGQHNDVFQSVWVGDHLNFSQNYLHDFGGQGFFVKDQASPIDGLVAIDNLIVNQDLPCDPANLCSGFQLSPFQLFGPVKNANIRLNTVGFGRGGGTAVLTGSFTGTFSNNVFKTLAVTNSGGSGVAVTGSDNTRCSGNGWPAPQGTQDGVCNPPFADPAAGNWQLPGTGRGVNWAVAEQHFGP